MSLDAICSLTACYAMALLDKVMNHDVGVSHTAMFGWRELLGFNGKSVVNIQLLKVASECRGGALRGRAEAHRCVGQSGTVL